MQVNCPNCGEKVTAENINIQKMTAVCAACDTVFSFELPEAKSKRRKVKQPVRLTLRDAETLRMAFRTNFRLDKDEAFLVSGMGSAIMLFVGLMLLSANDAEMPVFVPLGFLLIGVALLYRVALSVVNKTTIEMDEDTIRVARGPLPDPVNQPYEVPLADVEAIKYEETATSKKEDYDTPRYRVWAETSGGGRRTIVNDVTEDYAVFVAQRLQERLYESADPDASRLADNEYRQDDELNMGEVVRASQNHHKR